ncbi:MAG: DUF3198 domain-containing protein [Candidatus Thermoplasmatota archaeon]|nr:DUF3198 domain-containing protein [Candidatus Thermoplasmatota archaeon]
MTGKKISLKQRAKDNRLWIALATSIIGAAGLFFSICGDPVFGVWNVGIMKDFAHMVGDWNWWIFLLSIIAAIAGAGYFIDFLRKKSEFMELIDTSSKKAYLEKQEDIEMLAWKLGTSFEALVDEKMAQLRIKR